MKNRNTSGLRRHLETKYPSNFNKLYPERISANTSTSAVALTPAGLKQQTMSEYTENKVRSNVCIIATLIMYYNYCYLLK